MKSFEKVKKFHVLDVFCDVCGKSCREGYNTEYGSLQADCIESDDQSSCNIDLCEDCFKKTILFLKGIAANNSKLTLG